MEHSNTTAYLNNQQQQKSTYYTPSQTFHERHPPEINDSKRFGIIPSCAACFSPSKDTFLKAIQNNHFLGWPGLTTSLIKKHLPITSVTTKGYLKQERQGLQPTSKMQSVTAEEDMYTQSDILNVKTHDAIFSIISKSDKAFMDLTGRFPHCSSRGNEYILVA